MRRMLKAAKCRSNFQVAGRPGIPCPPCSEVSLRPSRRWSMTHTGVSRRSAKRSSSSAGGDAIYSGAYIMPSGSSAFGTTRKHRAHLKLLKQMMDDEVALRITDTRNMLDAFTLLRSYPMIGDFLAYQYVTDLNYSNLTNFSEMEFV